LAHGAEKRLVFAGHSGINFFIFLWEGLRAASVVGAAENSLLFWNFRAALGAAVGACSEIVAALYASADVARFSVYDEGADDEEDADCGAHGDDAEEGKQAAVSQLG
jgi:hypothetical protein